MTPSPPSVLSYIDETMTFVRWATCLPRWVLATRNDYAWHLARSFSVKWHGPAMRSAVFPLPVPFPGCFDGGGPWLSSSRMKVLAQKRVVHLIVVALNFMHLRRFATDFELRRFPNRAQQLCFRRLYSLVAACGYRPEPLPVVPGRAGAELISCMDTLERFLVEHEVFSGGYCQGDRIPFVPRVEDEEEKAKSFPQLRPYRALDVGRLRISGRGEWPLADYVDGVLWLPFVEPAVLRHDFDVADCPMPSFAGEKRDEYLRLARRWDELGLLRLHEANEDVGYCKIFNTWKNQEQDRQIGDRRSVNARERSISGPSAQLPCGTSLLNMSCQRGFCLRGSITDRRDFYHQVQVTRSRSSTNLTPFGFSREELGGLSALEEFERAGEVGAFDRKVHGDRYGKEPMTRGFGAALHPSFGALYQGDHLGVEFALAGHESLLRREGLLVEDQRLQTKRAPPLGSTWQGLIIDDYFVVSAQSSSSPMERSSAFLHLARARAAYEKHSLPGSTEKDVVAARTFKAAGAEVDSSPEVGSLGLCLVGSPLQKRLGLGLLSLRLAGLEGISSRLASRVSGSWVSVLLYRRCIGSVVEDLFALGAKYEEDGGDVVMPLTRRVSQELTFLAVLAPIAVSDLASSFSRRIFATDSSMEKGAIVETTLRGDVAKGLWLGGDRRGCYTKLQNPFRVLRKQVHPGLDEDLLEEGDEAEVEESPGAVVHRGVPFYFDFVEVCGGAGSVSHAMDLLGFSVAPTLDLSDSSHYDLKNHRLLEWIFHMLEEGRFRSVMCEPPCTTFSPAAHPAVRSYSCPKGFNRLLPKVLDGNILAFRSFCIMMVARRKRRPSLLEQPRLSKMCWLSIWKWLRENGFDEFVCASCMFRSKHRKEFRLLSYGLPAEDMDVRCCGGHFHVRIEGKYTRDSAMYTPELAMHFARGFARGLRKMRLEDAAGDVPGARRKESLLINDILVARDWRVVRSWFWKGRSHINLLETGVVVSLQKQLLADGLSGRYVVLMDSSVGKGALSEGRSSSRALQPLLQRSASIQLAGGQYFAYGFAPTRLNISDDPTRNVPLRPAVRHSLFEVMPYEELYHSHFVGLARFQANWVRLVLLSSLLPAVGASSPNHHHQSSSWIFPVSSGFVLVTLMLSVWIFALRDFSGLSKNPKNDRFSGTFISFRGGRLGTFLAMVFVNCTLVAAPLVPETANEAERAGRRERIFLASDRVVLSRTRENRYRLLEQFSAWLWEEHGVRWEAIMSSKPADPEEISKWLVSYGRDLHAAGKSYTKYSETVNAVSMIRPVVKKHLTAAWDLAFAWLQDEPHNHHPALPLSILVSIITLGLMWGWAVEASLFGLAWTGLLRVGELLDLTRESLILPEDSAPGIPYILIKIREPKTRGRGPRHQNARVEPKDIVDLAVSVFRHYSSSQKLWPLSASTLRKRFVTLLSRVGVKTIRGAEGRCYDMGSFRPGGATHLLTLTEDTALVQRRGRWASQHVMNIYLQEVAVATSLSVLDDDARRKIDELCSIYESVLQTCLRFLKFKIPFNAWNLLLKRHTFETGKFGV